MMKGALILPGVFALLRGLLMLIGTLTIIGYSLWYFSGSLSRALGAHGYAMMDRLGGKELPVPGANVKFLMWRHGNDQHGLGTVDAHGRRLDDVALTAGAINGEIPVPMYVRTDGETVTLWLFDAAIGHKAVIDRASGKIALTTIPNNGRSLETVVSEQGLGPSNYIGALRRPIRAIGEWELKR